ncbi:MULTISPECIES: hypothetical protein [Stenotrophomonas]|uniref:hypothetical protein n=1 Tax=Stenotrophomonas TaxID=40323 RepID=UPI00114C9F15|nr:MULTISPECIES: hypothetical protein [Stenotrophomonas]MCF3527429.1 hypothetical protein [Stenotrophomonas maltophilia]MCF3531313.1 hypothetical protein [Stenotrophomonas maltophilia]
MATKKSTGGRRPGSKNHSPREDRLLAQVAALKAGLAAEKAKGKVKDAEKKELRVALSEAKKKAASKTAATKKTASKTAATKKTPPKKK